MKLDENLKNQLIERLKPLNPEKVVLFGSYAYGEPSKDSDIDLIVVTDDDIMPSNFDEKMQFYLKVSMFLQIYKERSLLTLSCTQNRCIKDL